ncbi:6-phospho-3-hexuloisomerase [Microbacteriaceae bacterium VKM Ac-2854]|nr:6-phospho-3-hexuloisomerase [Microbacteriaceae bacterium VKM Ac-2854]
MSSTTATRTSDSIRLIAAELAAAAEAVAEAGTDDVAELLRAGRRVFVFGAGRSGLALRMTAMRLMHLGYTVHVVGDATAPAIAADDVLLVASGSGTTTGVVRAAETAASVGARVAVLTAAAASPLVDLADALLLIPAQTKQDHSATASAQYSGSLFEQTVVLVGDALFHTLWQASGLSAEALWPRHANLE